MISMPSAAVVQVDEPTIITILPLYFVITLLEVPSLKTDIFKNIRMLSANAIEEIV